MIFHENRQLSYFCRKLGKMSQNVSSAAVVIGALRIKANGFFKGIVETYIILGVRTYVHADLNLR